MLILPQSWCGHIVLDETFDLAAHEALTTEQFKRVIRGNGSYKSFKVVFLNGPVLCRIRRFQFSSHLLIALFVLATGDLALSQTNAAHKAPVPSTITNSTGLMSHSLSQRSDESAITFTTTTHQLPAIS